MAVDLSLFPASEAPDCYGPQPLAWSAEEATEDDPQARFGFITAEVIDGVLTIRGDAGDNYLQLYGPSPSLAAEWSMLEQLRTTYSITTYNTGIVGVAAFNITTYVSFQYVTAIDIDLGGGHDFIRILNSLAAPLTLRTGDGDDEILIRGHEAYAGMAGFYSFSGPAESLPMQGNLLIDTGAGNDELKIDAVIEGNATILMGDGDDSLIKLVETAQFGQGQYFGKFQATGQVTVDLGADQDIELIPANWRDDLELVDKVTRYGDGVNAALDFYRGLVERGEATSGVRQSLIIPGIAGAGRVDAEGRLEVVFNFTPGFERVIDRLQSRGVILEAYSINRGVGRALIREEDLKLFANLPGLSYLSLRIYPLTGEAWLVSPESANLWDFVLPGSSTAEVVVAAPSAPIYGPPRLEDVAANPNLSLLDSYFSRRRIGPQLLQ